jgi:multicomponent K+:H+ antiporter subunit E
MRKVFPAPMSSVALLALWLALAREATLGQLLVGLALAVLVPIVTASLRPTTVHVRQPAVVARFILRVGYDVLAANFAVAWGVVASHWRKPRARFVVVPLDLRDPHGLAALAMVVTIVPGTVWSELALDRTAVMLHVWDVDEVDAFVARFKARYEEPLREIFE